MLVLNSLPNVQTLNGRSTKDDDDEEEEDEEKEYNENNNENQNRNLMNIRNNHFFPQMEEIEEDKNMENNYNSYENNTNKEPINGNNNSEQQGTPEINIQLNNEEEEGEKQNQAPLFNQIISDNSNKKSFGREEQNKKDNNIIIMNNNTFNNNTISSTNLDNYLIDITNEELNIMKDQKYDINSEFLSILKGFGEIFNNQENEEENKIENDYINKMKEIENKKGNIPNYYYFFLLYKKKMKTLKKLFDEIFPYILNKLPELNKNKILIKLYNELFNSIKDSKELISTLHNHVESYNNKNKDKNTKENKYSNNDNENIENLNKIITEKNNEISLLQSQKEELLKNMKEEKNTYETKIATLEKENKIMTKKLLDKANLLINSSMSLSEQKDSVNLSSKKQIKLIKNRLKPQSQINYRNHSQILMKSKDNTDFDNFSKKRNTNYSLTGNNKTKSPMKSGDNTISFDNYVLNTNLNVSNINNINCINNNTRIFTNNNCNIYSNKHQLISLKTLKDIINEIYVSKTNYDIKCLDFRLPRETLEEHMYT